MPAKLARSLFQACIVDVAGGNQQQRWLAGNQERLREVCILAYHDASILPCSGNDFSIRGEVLPGQIECVQRVLSSYVQPSGEAPGELRVDKKPHAAKRSSRLTCAKRAAKDSAAKMSSRSRSS